MNQYAKPIRKFRKEVKFNNYCYHKVVGAITILGEIEKKYWNLKQFDNPNYFAFLVKQYYFCRLYITAWTFYGLWGQIRPTFFNSLYSYKLSQKFESQKYVHIKKNFKNHQPYIIIPHNDEVKGLFFNYNIILIFLGQPV